MKLVCNILFLQFLTFLHSPIYQTAIVSFLECYALEHITLQFKFSENLLYQVLESYSIAYQLMLNILPTSVTTIRLIFHAIACRHFIRADALHCLNWHALLSAIMTLCHITAVNFHVIGNFCTTIWQHPQIQRYPHYWTQIIQTHLTGTFNL